MPLRISAPWNDRLAEPLAKEHLVQLYEDDGVLIEAVALYAGRGLGKGEAVVLVATSTHLEAIERRLGDVGFEVADLMAWGQLVALDAAGLLSRCLVDGRIDAGRFEAILSDVIASARRGGRYSRVRVYGEMVNLLWRHNHPATRRLEELWNEAIEVHSLSLLCGYRVDGGRERDIPGDLQALHSHLIPLEASTQESHRPLISVDDGAGTSICALSNATGDVFAWLCLALLALAAFAGARGRKNPA